MAVQLTLFPLTKQEDYKANAYTGIYAMHKYWSKKPYNIVREFIEKYSHENDIVVDPFCGSGIAIVESIMLGRKAIGIDINPAAIFISQQMLYEIDYSEIKQEFEKLKNKVKPQIDDLYRTERDGYSIIGSHFIWEKGELSEIWYFNGNRKKSVFKPTRKDIEKAHKITLDEIPFFYPKNEFMHNSRINTKKGQKIYELFTPRNLFALSLLFHEINSIPNERTRNFFKFVFTSSIGQSSKMVFIVKRRGKKNGNIKEKKEVGSWVIGYWTPNDFFEINVWKNFESRFNKTVRAKNKQRLSHFILKESTQIQDVLQNDKNLCLLNAPAQEVLKTIPDNSVDYIITDPPHGDRIPYLELSVIWNSWLQKDVDFENEIVISNAKERKKDKADYNRLINQVFREIYRILKPNKYFTLMFNSLNDETWSNVIRYLSKLGFQLLSVETLGYSANSVIQDNRKKGLKTDFVLTFVKKENHIPEIKMRILKEDKDYLYQSVETIIKNLENTEIYHIINAVFKFFLKRNEFFKVSEVLKILEEKGF